MEVAAKENYQVEALFEKAIELVRNSLIHAKWS